MSLQVTGNESQFNEKVTFLKNIDVNGNVVVGSGVTINASTGEISANSFVGDGSLLTGVVAANNGVYVTKNNVLVGTPGIGVTIGLGTGLNGNQSAVGIVTIFLDATINDLTNVNASPNTSDVLQWNGSTWVAANPTSIGSTIWKTVPTGAGTTQAYYNNGPVAIGTDSVWSGSGCDLILGSQSFIRFEGSNLTIRTIDSGPYANVNIGAGFPVGTGGTANFIAPLNGLTGRFVSGAMHNTIIGCSAGGQLTSGSCNIFFGQCAGFLNDTGNENIFLGKSAGFSNNTGNQNIFLGSSAGFNHTTGQLNVFIGQYAGSAAQGCCNNYIGYCSGTANGGCNNNFLGTNAGSFSLGCNNNFIGAGAGGANLGLAIAGYTSGCYSNFIGYCAGFAVGVGTHNNFLGTSAGAGSTGGSYNTSIGYEAGYNNSTGGNCNLFIGYGAGAYNTTGSDNIILGTLSGLGDPISKFTGSSNVILGKCAGYNATTATSNVFIGAEAACNIQSGDSNISIGNASSCLLTNGSKNVTIGFSVGRRLSTGGNNVLIGSESGCGDLTLGSTASQNVFIGLCAGKDVYSGGNNVAVGSYAGKCLYAGCNNVILGTCAAYCLTNGLCNVSIGCESGKFLTTGQRNVFIGQNAGRSAQSGDCNVMIGSSAGFLSAGSFFNHNNIAIGWNAGSDLTFGLHCLYNQSNKIVIGNTDITNFYTKMAAKSWACTTVKWDSTSYELAADTSSCRFKTNIEPFLGGVDEILKLNSVKYNPIENPDGHYEIGLIAEQVAEAGLTEIVAFDADNQPLSVSYDRMAALFINAIKELHQENQQLKNEISLIKKHLDL